MVETTQVIGIMIILKKGVKKGFQVYNTHILGGETSHIFYFQPETLGKMNPF